MGNIDTNTINSLLEKIASIKAELEAVENEIRNIVPAAQAQMEDIDISIGSDIELSEGIDITIDEPVEAAEPLAVPETEDVPEPAVAPEPVVVPEPVAVPEPEEVPEPAAPEPVAEPDPVAVPEPVIVPEPVAVPEPEPVSADDDLPFFDDAPAPAPVTPAPEKQTRKTVKAIVDSMTAETAVMDVMADRQAWRTDRAGTPVKNVISAISLNDRVFLINVLFNEDPMLFQDTIAAFNGMANFQEAIDYVMEKFPSWDLNSEPVYRLMMAVRRKLG